MNRKLKKPKVKMIAYSNGESEVIICLPQDEKKMIKEYFPKGGIRSLVEYNRAEITGVINLYPHQYFSFDGDWT